MNSSRLINTRATATHAAARVGSAPGTASPTSFRAASGSASYSSTCRPRNCRNRADSAGAGDRPKQARTAKRNRASSSADALANGVGLRTVGLLASWQARLKDYPEESAAR